jgi:thymidylate kinase
MHPAIATFQNRAQYACVPIGLAGFASAGKDTVASLLMSYMLGKGFANSRIGLADKVKSMCADLYGFSHEQCHGVLKDVVDERYGQTPRYFFQRFGTEVARTVWADTWINYALEEMQPGFVFIPDVRFPNEAVRIRQRGGIIIGVLNDRVVPTQITHESEEYTSKLVETAEMRAMNHTSLADLSSQIPQLFEHLLLLTGVPNVRR